LERVAKCFVIFDRTSLKNMDLIINNRWSLGPRIARGAFGLLFSAVDLETGKAVAVKLEGRDARHPQLQYEYRVYQELASPWLPRIYWFGQSGDYNCLVMELLGPSLQRHTNVTVDDVMQLAPKMLQRLEMVHRVVVHRDIKPDNFILGLGDKANSVYLIDFGLSKPYRQADGQHIAYREDKSPVGTPRFSSIRTHLGCEQSRRDDLESLAYVLIYLANGSLPWQDQKANRRRLNSNICELKQAISSRELCRGLPSAFRKLVDYARALAFEEQPNYAQCRALFHQCSELEAEQ